jgi:hypothetical protein
MNAMPQVSQMGTLGIPSLAYVKHMAETARTKAARRVFEAYIQAELQRLATPSQPHSSEERSPEQARGRVTSRRSAM